MTGRTHDLAAFTALNYIIATQPLMQMSLATAIVAFSANMVGGLAPDLDQPTAKLWHEFRGGSLLGKILHPLFGGHRFISHSLIGVFLFGFLMRFALQMTKNVLIVDGNIVWWSFMIGYLSHLIADTFTHDGVPWLFPIPWKIGFPPFRFMRIETGGIVEKSFVFPVLLMSNIVIYYTHYNKFLDLLKHYIK